MLQGRAAEGQRREIWKPGLCWVALRRLQVAVVIGFSQVQYLISPGSFWLCGAQRCWGALVPGMGHLCFRKDFSKPLWSAARAKFVTLCFVSSASEYTSVYTNLL